MATTPTTPNGERLDSWKEIASYLNRSVRTVHRWEKDEGLPVHRQLHKDLGSSSRSGGVNLWRIPVDGGTAEALTRGSGEDLDPTVSPDGRMLLFANVKRTWALVVQDVHGNRQRIVLEQRRPLAFPRYSPDGNRIAMMGRNSRGNAAVGDAE